MENPKIDVVFENGDVLVVNKPPHVVVFSEKEAKAKSLLSLLLKKYPQLKKVGMPPRYGLVHRLDKETSGILLIAKNEKALHFLQKQFKKGEVLKKYIALVVGQTREDEYKIESLIGRSLKNKTKQKVYLPFGPRAAGKRVAITHYRVIKRFPDYTLLEVTPKTGRKHQIRVHLSYANHPIAGDKKYGFRNQPCPSGLKRHFLHAYFLKIKLPNKKVRVFKSKLPEDLKETIKKLKEYYANKS